MTERKPIAEATMPMPMPVLPAVPSTIAPPGLSAPLAMASLTMASAARSLTDPPGFMNSALPRISQPVASDAARKRINGVLPMASITEGLIKIQSSHWRTHQTWGYYTFGDLCSRDWDRAHPRAPPQQELARSLFASFR